MVWTSARPQSQSVVVGGGIHLRVEHYSQNLNISSSQFQLRPVLHTPIILFRLLMQKAKNYVPLQLTTPYLATD